MPVGPAHKSEAQYPTLPVGEGSKEAAAGMVQWDTDMEEHPSAAVDRPKEVAAVDRPKEATAVDRPKEAVLGRIH